MGEQYNADHGTRPPVRVRGYKWKYWYNYFLSYNTDPKDFYCPAAPRTEKLFVTADDPLLVNSFSSKILGYGMNL